MTHPHIVGDVAGGDSGWVPRVAPSHGDGLYGTPRPAASEPAADATILPPPGLSPAPPATSSAGQERQRAQRSAQAPRRDPAPGGSKHRAIRLRLNMPLWQELPLLLILAFGIAVLVRTFAVQAFYIPSRSMEESLLIGDRVLVNKAVYDLRTPRRGEVVVFRGPPRWAPEARRSRSDSAVGRIARGLGDLVGVSQPGEKDFVKRVIGLPGDTIACCDRGRVTVNGVGVQEPYIYDDSPDDIPPDPHSCGPRRFDPVRVPEAHVFMMGDHRGVSQDSRCQGPVPVDNIIGKAFVVVWPVTRWSFLAAHDATSDGRGERAAPSVGRGGDIAWPAALIGLQAVGPRRRLGCRGD